ncbi:MAG: hypothetical protein ACYC61_30735 [Isosphaeraceae bacterium]
MPFSQATIESVAPPRIRGSQVYLAWTSSSPSGTSFQVYINQRLAWAGRRLSCWIPIPSGPVRIDIGTVGVGEEGLSFASSLPAAPGRRAQLTWQSGSYKGADLAGFHIYGSDAPGGPVDTSTVLADITAYPAGIATDGFGVGGFGSGGFGQAAGSYTWTSAPLAAGTWTFAVAPYDSAGNIGASTTTTVAIAAPPRAPAAAPGTTSRLQYLLEGYGQTGFGSGGFGLPAATLQWNPSPP